MAPTTTEAVKTNLSDAGTSIKQAAVDAGTSIKDAASAAGDHLRVAKATVKGDLADGALAGINALENIGGAAGEQMDVLMDKGRDLIESAAELVRERPLTSFGVAFAAGWIIAKLARGNGK